MKKLITAVLILTMAMTAFAAEVEVGIAPPENAQETQGEPGAIYGSISMTEEEERLLTAIVWGEANNQDMTGQMAVVEVIFNRVLSDRWPNTVYGVLSQAGQFATWKSRNAIRATEMQSDAIAAVMAETYTVLPDTEYVFFATRKHKWMHDCIKLGGHWFGK